MSDLNLSIFTCLNKSVLHYFYLFGLDFVLPLLIKYIQILDPL